jgi:hypothetical protein
MVKSSGRLHPARIGSNTTSVCTEGSPSSRAHADNDYAVVPLITAYGMEGRQNGVHCFRSSGAAADRDTLEYP